MSDQRVFNAAAAMDSEAFSSKRRRRRAAPPGRCQSCNRAETSEWRRGPDGARTLCNACGLHYAKLTRKMAGKGTTSSNPRPKTPEPERRASNGGLPFQNEGQGMIADTEAIQLESERAAYLTGEKKEVRLPQRDERAKRHVDTDQNTAMATHPYNHRLPGLSQYPHLSQSMLRSYFPEDDDPYAHRMTKESRTLAGTDGTLNDMYSQDLLQFASRTSTDKKPAVDIIGGKPRTSRLNSDNSEHDEYTIRHHTMAEFLGEKDRQLSRPGSSLRQQEQTAPQTSHIPSPHFHNPSQERPLQPTATDPSPPQYNFQNPLVPQPKPLHASAKHSTFTPIDDSQSMFAAHGGFSNSSVLQSTKQKNWSQFKWTPEEDNLIIELRGQGVKWDNIAKRLPGRSSIACRLHYQNYLEKEGTRSAPETESNLSRSIKRPKIVGAESPVDLTKLQNPDLAHFATTAASLGSGRMEEERFMNASFGKLPTGSLSPQPHASQSMDISEINYQSAHTFMAEDIVAYIKKLQRQVEEKDKLLEIKDQEINQLKKDEKFRTMSLDQWWDSGPSFRDSSTGLRMDETQSGIDLGPGILPPTPPRSKTGCLTCRKRKKKCDETKPSCLTCQKSNIHCEGYETIPIWKSGKERAAEQKRNALVMAEVDNSAAKNSAIIRVRPHDAVDLTHFTAAQLEWKNLNDSEAQRASRHRFTLTGSEDQGEHVSNIRSASVSTQSSTEDISKTASADVRNARDLDDQSSTSDEKDRAIAGPLEANILTELDHTIEEDWTLVQNRLPEDWMWDVEYQSGCWTCTPLEADTPKHYPLTIAGAPVVLPVEYQWPPIGGVNPPPDPRPSAPIDCRAEMTLEIVRDLFLTFEGSVGFYVLISGLLQIIVSEDFDTAWASSHLPHKYGGLKVCYIPQTLEATMLPSSTATTRTDPVLNPQSTSLSSLFRRSRTSTGSSNPPLKLNDFIEARPKANHRNEKFSGRIGLQVTDNFSDDPFLVMSTHIITEAILARSHRDALLGRSRSRFEKLDGDWNELVDIWAGNEKIGTIEKSFDQEPEIYPIGFRHDVTLVKPTTAASARDIVSPVSDLGWLNRASWCSLRQQSSAVKILGPTETNRAVKSLQCSRPSEISIVGEGIFLNQNATAQNSKSLKDHDVLTWKSMVARALLYRVHPDFDPPNGHSGVALYAEGTREDGTTGPGVVGFQSFVQRSGHVQNFRMEGSHLERRLHSGRVAFFGAFEVPNELKQGYTIV